MMRFHPRFTLAVSSSPRGFAFVLFDGPDRPFDWGVKRIYGSNKNARCIAAIQKLLLLYRPETLVLEDTTKKSRRGPRIQALQRAVEDLAHGKGIPVARATKSDVRRVFGGAATRPQIATAIAARIPALAPHVPPPRKIWMSEHPRQSLFDAAALAMAHYESLARSPRITSESRAIA